jgi:hypothetical protein
MLSFPVALALTFFLPEELSFRLFGLVMQPYRLLLLAAFLPAIFKLVRERLLTSYDLAMAMLAVPIMGSMLYHRGLADGLDSGGLAALEISGSYFVARAYLNSLQKLSLFVRAWIVLALILLPFIVIEAVSRSYIIHPLISVLTGLHYDTATAQNAAGLEFYSRWGLLRAMGTFSHPILCGVAYAAFVPYALFEFQGARRILVCCGLLLGVTATVSSTPFVMMAGSTGVGILIFVAGHHHWRTPVRSLAVVVAPMYLALDFLSNRGPFTILATTLALNPWTGYYRTLIWKYGMDNVWSHPVFGLGYGDWVRPHWMTPSVDAYWLVVGMRHGAIAFVLFIAVFLAAFIHLLSLYGTQAVRAPVFRRTACTWLATFFAAALGGIVVDYWGPMAMLMPLILGVTVNLIAAERRVLAGPSSINIPVSMHRGPALGAANMSA